VTLRDLAIRMLVDDYTAIRRAFAEISPPASLSPDGIAMLVLAAHTAQLHEALTAIGTDVDKSARMLDAIDDRLAAMNRRYR